MSYEQSGPGGVTKSYGVRQLGGYSGVVKTVGSKSEYTFELSQADIQAGAFVAPTVILGLSTVLSAKVFVEKVFAGTFDLEVGKLGAEATDGVTVSGTDLDALGFVDVSAGLSGTFAVGSTIPANIELGLKVSSGSVTTFGRAKLVLEVQHIS